MSPSGTKNRKAAKRQSAAAPAGKSVARASAPAEPANLPDVITPAHIGDDSATALILWLGSRRRQFLARLDAAGAILLRDFAVADEFQFETVLRAFDFDLKSEYLGTSPRDRLTEYVYTASELPAHYPIMQHCEMSFLDSPPERLYFFCKTAPEADGETPICDFRKVWRELDPSIRAEFDRRGIKYVRRYSGPGDAVRSRGWRTKRWDEMFGVSNIEQAIRHAQAAGLQAERGPGDELVLTNRQAAARVHPRTGVTVWHNHSQVFHPAAASFEYRKIARRQRTPRAFILSLVIDALTFAKRIKGAPESFDTNALFGDGQPIPSSYIKHVTDVIWENLQFFAWRQGDILAIDNRSVSHGRMPFKGPRRILVAWSG